MKTTRESWTNPLDSFLARQSSNLSTNALMSIVLLIFFLSGFSALTYQVVWVKTLSRVFGVTSFAVTTVLAAFMGGMALGSYIGGRIVGRRSDGLWLFGWLEIGLGCYVLVMPKLFEVLFPLYRAWYSVAQTSSVVLLLARFGLASLILLLPTTFMGATFPILVHALVGRREELGQKLARLYTWNTMGSVIGSVVTGYFLIGVWGLNATTLLAAVFNIAVGVAALTLFVFVPSSRQVEADKLVSPSKEAFSKAAILGSMTLFVLFAAGFAGLGYEVVWMRVLTLLSDHAIYAFSAIVAIVLMGIAVGSIWAARLAQRGVDPLPTLIVAQVGLGTLAALWLPMIVVIVQVLVRRLGFEANHNPFFGVALLLTLIPSLFMGISFPLAVQVYVSGTRTTGRQVGEANSANVLGAMLGSITAGFVLIPLLGSQRSLLVLALLNLGSALSLSVASRLRAGVILSGGLAIVVAMALTLAPNTLYRSLFESIFPSQKVVRLFESVEGTVAVTEAQDMLYISVNGVHEADTLAKTLAVHHLIGYLPYFLHPAPEDALIVGVGGGATSDAIAQYIHGKLQIVELSEGMLAAARMFSDYNNQVLNDSQVRLIVADGRNYALLADEQYDVIAADTIYPLHAYSSNLYSVDYYRLLATRLKPGGLMVQWIDTTLPEREQRVLIRTFLAAFPHVISWKHTELLILLGSNQVILPNPDRIARHFTPAIAQAVAPQGISGPGDILSGFAPADQALRLEVGPGIIISDDHPYNEYFRLFRATGIWQWLEK